MTTKRPAGKNGSRRDRKPTPAQLVWLGRGLEQPGGKLPLFDGDGQRVDPRTIQSCLDQGWAEPWFANPLKPDWLVCKLTAAGRAVATVPGIVQPGIDQPATEQPPTGA